MSDIYGNGYGDKHNWKKGDTEEVNSIDFLYGNTGGQKSTYYKCIRCGAEFRHYYDNFSEEDIFEAMRFRQVPENCQR